MSFSLQLPGGMHGPHRSAPVIAVAFCSLMGLAFLLKGIRGEIFDEAGITKAPRWLYLTSGIALQIPALVYAFAVDAAN